jgi:hypothetical protein
MDDAEERGGSSASSPTAPAATSSSATSSSASTVDAELTLERALEIAGWPASLCDEAKQPWVLDDERVFKDLLMYGSHIDRIIVLRDGIARLGLERALPEELASLAEGETCVRKFLDRLGDDEKLRGLRGRVYCTRHGAREERELKKDADGAELDTLADKRSALRERDARDGVYMGELRRAQKYKHSADGSWSKSLLSRGACDALTAAQARAMPYWCASLPP